MYDVVGGLPYSHVFCLARCVWVYLKRGGFPNSHVIVWVLLGTCVLYSGVLVILALSGFPRFTSWPGWVLCKVFLLFLISEYLLVVLYNFCRVLYIFFLDMVGCDAALVV